jgi:UDP-N-acetylmuramoyl-tripeptide--D-alanyl-D-alanine ligase
MVGDDGGCAFTVRDVAVRLALEGRHQARNAVAAMAAAEFAGVEMAEAARALREVAVAHRLQEHQTPKGVTIVDDSYNASPESMLAAFETLAERPRQGRLLAVLGAMRELGSVAVESHTRVGRRAAEVFDAVAVLDSDLGRVLADASGGHLVPDRESAVMWVRNNARRGDRVLVKASHSAGLDEVVKELTK